MARWTTALVAAGMIAAVGIAALGCSMSQPTRAVVNVTSHDGGTVQLGGATLTLPPGAATSPVNWSLLLLVLRQRAAMLLLAHR